MEDKEVVIAISTTQQYENDETDHIDFTTDGLYRHEDGVTRMTYYESAVTGLDGTRTTVEVFPEEVTVRREGRLTGKMVFKKGQKNSFLYDTPYGMATMNIRTHSINGSFNENGGNMVIDYVLDMEHVAVVKNKFTVDVKEISRKNGGVNING